MTIEINTATKIVEAGTAEFTETFAPPRPDANGSAPEAERPYDQVIPLGSSVLAPGLSTPIGR